MAELTPEALAGILRELEQRADDCDALAAHIDNRGGLADGNRRVAQDAGTWRAHAAKVRGWAAQLASAKPVPQLSERDRADACAELEEHAENLEMHASHVRAPDCTARAARIRELIATLSKGG